RRTGKMGDFSISAFYQELHRRVSTLIIVHSYAAGFKIRTHPVEKNDRHIFILVYFKMAGIAGLSGYGHYQTIYFIGKQSLRHQYFAFVRFTGLTNDYFIARFIG